VKNKRRRKKINLAPLSVAGTALTELMTFIELSVAGLKDATRARQILNWNRMAKKVLGEREPCETEEHYTVATRHAERLEVFAKAEAKYDFPYLYGMAASRLWSINETMVDDLIAYLLQTRPECKKIDIVRKLEGPLVAFAGANEEDRAKYLANLLTEHVKARFKLGVGRFEAVLNQIGLGGPVDPDVQKTILELSQIRHVIIHRLGKADERLVTNCPWLNLRLGQTVRITQKQFRRFYLAVFWYMLELDRRLATLASETTSEFKTKIHQECLDELRTACSTDNPATEPVLLNSPLKNNKRAAVVRDSERDRSQTESSVLGSDVSRSNELRDMLLAEDRKELKKTANRIAKSKREKIIIVTAHRFVEKLISDMIATRLVRPDVWLRNADYLSKVKLAKALGMLGQEEYLICHVLGSTRIAFEHLNSLPQNCRAKILRIAYAHFKKQPPKIGSQRPFNEIIRLLLAILSAPWLEIRFKKKLHDLRKRYSRQWSGLMKKNLWSNLDLLATDADSPENQRAVEQVDMQLLRRLRMKKTL
jgi:hypothetical protein